ncbi:response regulator [Larkinella humicola]|uniref:Response regulator n=1 Tax=Larkinella humicola TaxID=2607654 RepID=A0A5N1JRH1_9BACT|nr:response regulator [Larkinella humicola]KAA9356912.1 response regulator [Larkinella humicola]
MTGKQAYLTWIVDDDAEYGLLLQKAFFEKKLESRLDFFLSGQLVMERLDNADGELPDLILLDLELPKQDGIDTLSAIRNNPRGKYIPVLMVSNSASPATISLCYQLGVNAYVVKPNRFDDLAYFVNSICRYWLEMSDQLTRT